MSYWNPLFVKSLALSRFLNDHTLNNEFYWHSVLTKKLACKFSRNLSPNDKIRNLLNATTQPEPFRFPHQLIDWKNNISDHENWIRLNTLLASTAYLERYIYEICLLAFSNDPGVLIGKGRTVNGVHYLKNNIDIKGLNIIEKFTKGTWNQRYKFLKEYFEIQPEIDKTKIDTLDKIRTMRNKIAHRFGRDFVTDLKHFTKSQDPLERLSEERLKRYLGLINEVANSFDQNIFKHHVGNFEIVMFWHNWDKKEKHKSWGNWSDARKLKYGLLKHFNPPSLSVSQVEPILKYYNDA